jgi:hypothetical protein
MKYSTHEWTVKQLLDISNSGKLELSPSYQRNDIWTLPAKKRLIDSIKIGYPLPAFFLHLKPDGTYDMVDGQQRTRALIGYINRKFPDVNRVFFDQDSRSEILDYKISVVVIDDPSGQSIEDFYFRVNNYGSKLNRQEKIKAQKANSLFLNVVEELADSSEFSSLNIFSDAATERMIDVDFVSELLAQLKAGITDKKKVADRLYDIIQTPEEAQSLTNEFFEIIRVFKSFDKIYPINKTRYKQKNDFYTLFGFIPRIKDLAESELQTLYKILAVIGPDISPSNEDCPPFQEYAYNCVTQSNSKDARNARLSFFEELLTNPLTDLNDTQKDVIHFYGVEEVPVMVEDYTTVNAELINSTKEHPINFQENSNEL